MSPQADDVELTHLWAMRDATRRRLFALEEQSAHFGPGAPAHIPIEIERAKKDLELIEAKLQLTEPSPDVARSIGTEGRVSIVEWRMAGLGGKLDDALASFETQLMLIREEAREWRASERDLREERQRVNDARQQQNEARMARLETKVSRALIVVSAIAAALVWYLVMR